MKYLHALKIIVFCALAISPFPCIGSSDSPGGVLTYVGAGVASVVFIIVLCVIILVAVVCVRKKRKREVNGMCHDGNTISQKSAF